MWLYNNQELTDEMIPEAAQGFLYIMTYKPTGQRYIGRKLLTKAHRRQKNKKIIRSRIPSDWKTYYSSSPEILRIIEEEGNTDNFVREILVFANSKSHLNYLEEKFLYCVGSMESNVWMNSNIRSKVYKRNILDKLDTEHINGILANLINNQ